MTDPIRLLVVDDQSLFREGIISLLSTMHDFTVVGQASNGEEALQRAHELVPDVVLMDLRMPVLDGVEATRLLRAQLPAVRVVVLTTFDDDDSILDAIRAGALGFLLKDTPSAALAEGLRQAARGESFLTPRVATRLVQHVAQHPVPSPPPGFGDITTREREVLGLLGRGATNKDIAQTLRVAEGTVKNHLTSIFTKLGVEDRLQAAIVARDLGLVTLTRDSDRDS